MSEKNWFITDDEWVPAMFAAHAVRHVEPEWRFAHIDIIERMNKADYRLENGDQHSSGHKWFVRFGPFRDACREVCEPKVVAKAAAGGDLVASRLQAVLESIEVTQREFHALEIKFSKLSDRLGQMHHRLAYMEHHFKIAPEEKP